FVMLTNFSESVDGYVAYHPVNLDNTVGEVLSQHDLKQLRIAETEKDRKSTRLNSSHVSISYAVFCLKKKKKYININVIFVIVIKFSCRTFSLFTLILLSCIDMFFTVIFSLSLHDALPIFRYVNEF